VEEQGFNFVLAKLSEVNYKETGVFMMPNV